MTNPAHDLSKLRIDRDPPPAVRRALGRTLLFVGGLVVLRGILFVPFRPRSIITPGLLLRGLFFSLVMGLVGGLLPAWRAARMEVVKAIRWPPLGPSPCRGRA